MRGPQLISVLAAFALSLGCAHSLTAEEHRAEAERHQREAASEQRQYDPHAREMARDPGAAMGMRGPLEGAPGVIPPLATYNPTELHLEAAEAHRHAADSHLKAAAELERFEDAACTGLSKAERAGCPLLAPKVAKVEETSFGVRLHLKPTADGAELYRVMSCHLAFAHAHGYDSTSCPLYLSGVTIDKVGDDLIELRSGSAATAAQLRQEARGLFAPAPAVSSAR